MCARRVLLEGNASLRDGTLQLTAGERQFGYAGSRGLGSNPLGAIAALSRTAPAAQLTRPRVRARWQPLM